MFFRQLSIITLILISINLFGQDQNNQDNYYKRFEGKIGDNINVTANLVRLFDNVSGNYVYYYLEGENELHYGKTVELVGKAEVNDSVLLREFGSEDYTFKGLIRDGQYNGEWNHSESKALNFNMKEYYPNGSLPFEVYYLSSEMPLDKKQKESPTARIELALIFPSSEYFQPAIIDSVDNIIMDSYFGKGFAKSEPQKMLENFENEYFNNYQKQAENRLQSSPINNFNYQKQLNMSIIYNSNYLLCIEYLRYAYAGGSHGMSNLSYDIIDLNGGTKLSYEDVFDNNSDSLLSVLLTKQLRHNYKVPDEVSLKEAGFFVETVKPNKNLFVSGEGVGFVYNSYEIAPYSRGATTILLSYEKLENLIKIGSPIYKLSKH